VSGRQNMGEHPDRDVEERLRAALRDRARDFPASPDAWQRTLARRGDTTTWIRSPRNVLRVLAPLAAAAAVVAIAASLLIERGPQGPAPGGSQGPAASQPPSPGTVAPSLSPTHAPAPKGTRTPTACQPAPSQPPVYYIATVTQASMPAAAGDWLKQAPPLTGIVRVDVSYGVDRATTYLWFSRPRGGPEVLEHRTHLLLPAGTVPDPVYWHGRGVDLSTMLPGQTGYLPSAEGDRLVTYDFGLADSRVTSVTAGRSARMRIPASSTLAGSDIPVPGAVIIGHGFPYRVWIAAFPATPWYQELTFRDATGKSISTQMANNFPQGTMCSPLAYLDYKPPKGADAFVTGGAEPQVATVTAVLPDGSQVAGGFLAGGGTKATGYIWYWQVTLPRKDASLTVTLLFKDAAGRVLGHLTAVPGKNPFPAFKR
jgi:hypothetical protein